MNLRCSRCAMEKDESLFHRDSSKKTGRESRCKSCKADVRAALIAMDPARLEYERAACKKSYQKDIEASRAKGAVIRARRVPLRSEYNRAYYKANRDRYAQRYAEYYEKNRKMLIAKAMEGCALRLRRAKYSRPIIDANPWMRDEILAIYALAKRVSAETGVKHHVDHLVPLRSRLVCGLHVPANLAVVPASANMAKGNRVWPEMPQ